MTLQQLQYIIALNRERNFVAAAESCFVTQPALTVQVKNLEEELGIKIFDRSKKPLIPTEVGKIVIKQAQQVVDQLQTIPDAVDAYKNELKGTLRLGILPTLGMYLTPHFIQSFLNDYPQIELKITELPTEMIITQLEEDLLDLGLLATPVAFANSKTLPLFYEEMYPFVSPNHPLYNKKTIQTNQLNSSDLWLLGSGHCFRNQSIKICKNLEDEAHTAFSYESDSIEALKEIIAHSNGVTIIPELATYNFDETEKKALKKFEDITPIREISILVKRTFLKQRLIDKLYDSIRANLPSRMLKISGRDIITPF